jgi:hypothetical protein
MEKRTIMIIASIFALIMFSYFVAKFILEANMKSVPSIGIYMTFYTFMAFCTWLFCAPDETPDDTIQEAIPLQEYIPEEEILLPPVSSPDSSPVSSPVSPPDSSSVSSTVSPPDSSPDFIPPELPSELPIELPKSPPSNDFISQESKISPDDNNAINK